MKIHLHWNNDCALKIEITITEKFILLIRHLVAVTVQSRMIMDLFSGLGVLYFVKSKEGGYRSLAICNLQRKNAKYTHHH